jgi:hypothetical protein
MHTSDLVKQPLQTPLSERFVACGPICEIQTNSDSILKAARETFLPAEPGLHVELGMRFWVDSRDSSHAPWPKPYIRGLDHLVFAGFDSGSSALVNLQSRRAIGRFSPSLAADRNYWKQVIFPNLLTIVSGSLGIAELHCGCVARNRFGLLLVGPSGSGKSTLSLALAQTGFGFLSDDRTLCSMRGGKLTAWGMPVLLKLRSEAAAWFPELRGEQPRHMQKGELVFRCDSGETMRFDRVQRCEPRLVIFLEQNQGAGFQFSPISRPEAAARLAADLLAEQTEDMEKQTAIIERLVDLPCRRLEYDEPPQIVAQRLSHHFDRLESLS